MRGKGGIAIKINTPINKQKDRIIKIIRKKQKKRKRDIFDL